MDWVIVVVAALLAGAAGTAWGYLLAGGRARAAAAIADELRRQLGQSSARATDLEAQLRDAHAAAAAADARAEALGRSLGEQRALLDASTEKLSHTFRALAADALRASSEGFLALASERLGAVERQARSDGDTRLQALEGLVRPLQESLGRFDATIRDIERARAQAYGSLSEQVRALASAHERLRGETSNLVAALRAPAVRGRWGEIQLRRVVELAGMLEHCDFDEQATLQASDGRLRPDLIVRLPNGRSLVVDAKAPLAAYLDAVEAPSDVVRAEKMKQHAAQVRSHIAKLSAKAYWEQLPVTPEYVIMFLPGESFHAAALDQMPSLIEEGVAARVLVATPTTLIALLQAVHYGWRQERVAENAQQVSRVGRELHERIAIFLEHFGKVGAMLERSVRAFNDAAASCETRVLPSARRLEALDAAGKRGLPELARVETRVRLLVDEAQVLGGE